VKITVKPSFDRVGGAFKQMNLGKALQEGIEKLAFVTEAESKRATPVDTGRLRASIAVDMLGRRARRGVRTFKGGAFAAMEGGFATGKLKAIVGPHTNYATYVHEGTYKMGARPFMEWGLVGAMSRLRTRDPVFKELSDYIDTEIRKI